MRVPTKAAALLTALCFAQPAFGATGPVLRTPPAGGTVVPALHPGDMFRIKGACVTGLPTLDHVQVILRPMEGSDEAGPGYRRILATDQVAHAHGLEVRVPEVPDIINNTFVVAVYVLREGAIAMCEAGAIRVS